MNREDAAGPASGTPRAIDVAVTADAAADIAAALIVRAARDAIEASGRFVLALSGGRTPLPLFDRLAGSVGAAVAWPAVHLFWADERCVPPDDPESNYGTARARLAGVPLAPSKIHRIRGEMTPPVAAGVCRAELAAFFHAGTPAAARTAFDLVLLGIGADGHVASIFEDSPALDSGEWALDVEAPPGSGPRWRVTLTAAAIGAARQVVVLATGREKAGAVAAALSPGSSTPAGRLGARETVTWILDAAAASAIAVR